MNSYVDRDGWVIKTEEIMGFRLETVHGFAFEPHARAEQGAFGGAVRNCTPGLYPAAPTPEGAFEIARQRGETTATGRVVPVERKSLSQNWIVSAERNA